MHCLVLCSPLVHRLLYSLNIGCYVVLIGGRRVLGDNFLDRSKPHAHIDRTCYEHVPVLIAIVPAIHLRVSTMALVNKRTIRDASLVAKRHRERSFTLATQV